MLGKPTVRLCVKEARFNIRLFVEEDMNTGSARWMMERTYLRHCSAIHMYPLATEQVE